MKRLSSSFSSLKRDGKIDPNADMYLETSRAQSKVFKPRGVEINRFGTREEKQAWMKAKQAGLIGPGRKKKKQP